MNHRNTISTPENNNQTKPVMNGFGYIIRVFDWHVVPLLFLSLWVLLQVKSKIKLVLSIYTYAYLARDLRSFCHFYYETWSHFHWFHPKYRSNLIAAVKKLKYCRYGVKKLSNQSINQFSCHLRQARCITPHPVEDIFPTSICRIEFAWSVQLNVIMLKSFLFLYWKWRKQTSFTLFNYKCRT